MKSQAFSSVKPEGEPEGRQFAIPQLMPRRKPVPPAHTLYPTTKEVSCEIRRGRQNCPWAASSLQRPVRRHFANCNMFCSNSSAVCYHGIAQLSNPQCRKESGDPRAESVAGHAAEAAHAATFRHSKKYGRQKPFHELARFLISPTPAV